MRSLPLLMFVAVSAVALAALHWVAETLELYLDLWWFDLLMHALGGAVAGGLALALAHWVPPAARYAATLKGACVVAILGALSLGAVWECFEFSHGLVVARFPLLDTVGDLVMDAIGALVVARRFVLAPNANLLSNG